MCGLFGFFSDGSSASREALRLIVRDALRRGPDSVGAKYTLDGRVWDDLVIPTPRMGLASTAEIEAIAADLEDARAIVGHARLATSTRADDVSGIQPLTSPAGKIYAHNGTLEVPPDHEGSDSLLLGPVLDEGEGALREFLRSQGDPPIAVIWCDPADGAPHAFADQLPLWVLSGRNLGGWYLTSYTEGPELPFSAGLDIRGYEWKPHERRH